MIKPLLLCALVLPPALVWAQTSSRAAERYQSATAQKDGTLLIVTTGGRRIVLKQKPIKDVGPQTRFEDVRISPDRSAVGAKAMYGNCCTSYDIPLALVIYKGGREHRFGEEFPVWNWAFLDGSARVAYIQSTVHSSPVDTYELRDVASERALGTWERWFNQTPPDFKPDPQPEWARQLDAAVFANRK